MNHKSRVNFLEYRYIEEVANKVLLENKLNDSIPIEVERFIDNKLKINIIPFPELKRSSNINAFISINLRNIYIDDYLYSHLEPQYRFTLAHELGHLYLHHYIYDNVKDLESYIKFQESISEREYGYLEFQADCFAGLFLIPSNHLNEQFERHSREIINFIKRRFSRSKRDDYIDMAISLISQKLSPIFNVHHTPIEIRIKKLGLDKKIP